MTKLPGALAFVLLAAQLPAQSNEPVRLALISESDEASVASDVLTAQLSGNEKLNLLERNEVEKVYREQGLSAANRDDLKLGRILGADGLLLFNVVRTPQATNLTARLIAVKPGVVLTEGSFPWPLKDTVQWAESATTYLNSFLPKLTVLAKDAIPISVVNLRSAVPSTDAQEMERQLKLLTIQRLSQERQFFVLERQRMQLLTEEKELKSDESAFWNGSYLLEGVVDQNGYSKETITINARLTPPKGGAPLLFEISGSRTNFSEVVNRLAVKVAELLQIKSNVPEWNAADEAAQYFDEAKWALRWGIFSEAQAAAESAWALGKKDLACAQVRAKSYLGELSAAVGKYQKGESTISAGFDVNGKPLGRPPSEVAVQTMIRDMVSEHPFGAAYQVNRYDSKSAVVASFAFADAPPNPANIDRAMHLLELYYSFSRNHVEGTPKAGTAATDWRASEWDDMGIEILVAVSEVLQNFNFVPESQKPVADKLANLRALARSVAELISESPSVHDSYFVGDRSATHDELAHTIADNKNIFRCEVKWGCFWQERPEDEIALYRELMSSPVFCYIHKDFWLRELQAPQLIAWNENDGQRIPVVWNNFVRELDGSTNVLLQLEAKALAVADAGSETKMATAFTNLFVSIFESHDALVTNNVEVLYLDWNTDDLVNTRTSGGIFTDTKDSLNHLFYSEYRPKLEAMDQEFWGKTGPVLAAQLLNPNENAFEQQTRYLKENKPYDFMEFAHTFSNPGYSKAQALEIQPLLASYKSNLVAQSQNASRMQKGRLMGAIAQVGFLENNINRILNPPAPPTQPLPTKNQESAPVLVAKTPVAAPISTNAPEIVTNVILVRKFLAIPLNDLESNEISGVTITAHHWYAGKLLLDFRYTAAVYSFDENSAWRGTRYPTLSAIAILDPGTEHWEVIGCPEADIQSQNNFYHRSALLRGELFTSDGGQLRKYDFQNRQWRVLGISDGNNYELFAVNGHLYGANWDTIFEITDSGKATHLLASTRRRPSVSALDTQELGTPTLFEGPNHSLRVITRNKIFTWADNDWREDCSTPSVSSPPELFMDGVLFRQAGFLSAAYQNGVMSRRENGTYGFLDSQDEIYCLANETNVVKLCLGSGNRADSRSFSRPGMNVVRGPKPVWETPANLLPNLPAALRQPDLYLLEDAFAVHAIVNNRHEILQENVATKDGYNAALLCFSRDFPLPQKLFLKFDAPDAKTPTWMFPTTNLLFIGPETPLNIAPGGRGGGGGGKAGVWLIPVSQLEAAITAQRRIQIDQNAQEKSKEVAAAEQVQKNLLAQYDRNHNGVIDPEEKEEALDDPAFIESELDAIDANHNGWLDTEELAWFDANKDKILDPKEQAGIDIAQHLLAVRLLKKFDANGDGILDRAEFDDLWQSGVAARVRPMPGIPPAFPNGYYQGHVGLEELENFLKQQTRMELRRRQGPGATLFNPMRATNGSIDQRQLFKVEVESYWQNPGGVTNRPPFNRIIRPGDSVVTNGMQNVKTQ